VVRVIMSTADQVRRQIDGLVLGGGGGGGAR
jgi:hypothetical protein